MDYLSFYFTSWRCALSLAKAGDIIVAKTDPPMISLIGMAAAKQRGAKLINWVQDVYPEIAIEFGVPFLIAPVRRFLFWLRDMSLNAATTNVVLGQIDCAAGIGVKLLTAHRLAPILGSIHACSRSTAVSARTC